MPPEEFKKRMIEISAKTDTEERHVLADELMCEVLESLGYGTGVEVFVLMPKQC